MCHSGRAIHAQCSLESDEAVAVHSSTHAVFVALVLHVSGDDGLALQDRWMVDNEVEILRKVHHPNIVSLHEIFLTATTMSLVLDLCRGGELFEEVVKRGNPHCLCGRGTVGVCVCLASPGVPH